MTRPVRLGLFLTGMAALAATLAVAVGDLPGFGHYPGPYGTIIARTGVAARHGTDLVTTVNFDYRVFDTLGEEFILFTAVLGVALVLRRRRGEERTSEEPPEEHHFPGSSSALGAIGLALVGPVLVLGAWVVTHGHLTPGGGFQGGVVLAAAILIVFLAGEYVAMKRVAPHAALELAEASGAAGLALVGLGGLIFAGVFFKNFISLGSPGAILSAGTIPIGNLAVGIEVAGAFLMLWTEFSDQALVVRSR
ncbi:MAG TPA: MnhB domain-containing protein [Solirubrobacterales bacterium]|nr:MnhB domain-containing protein [Solirubrobacterales bacterium]